MKGIAILPARGGSVRVPRKNVRPFRGKPMLQWPIEVAKASGLFSEIVVTTDDREIADAATACGADVHWRQTDDGSTGTQEVAARVLEQRRDVPPLACVIYPTSPLLTVDDLIRGWRQASRYGTHYAMAVNPDPLCDAGLFYWGPIESFLRRLPLIGPDTRMVPMTRVCDINTEADWARAEAMFDELRKANV